MFDLRGLILGLFGFLAAASAQPVGPVITAGGITTEVCATPVVTAGAYGSGNVVGGLLTVAPFRPAVTGAPNQGGILQSIRVTLKTVQTAEFDVYQFSSNPTASTWTDKAAPAINVADVAKVLPPIKLTTPASGLGTHTVYGSDAIARAKTGTTVNDYFVIVVVGTPTLGSTSDLQFCATYLVD